MQLKQKEYAWDGAKKKAVRNHKLEEAKDFYLETNNLLKVLSLPGAKAKLEKALIKCGVTNKDHVICVQTAGHLNNHDGSEVLYKLLKHKEKFNVWPDRFSTFTHHYPNLNWQQLQLLDSAWAKQLLFRNEMHKLCELPAFKFNFLDIDLCGVFSQKNAEDILRLFQNGAVEKKAVLFINHQKGRDGKGFNYLANNIHFKTGSPYHLKIANKFGKFSYNKQTNFNWDVTRYSYVPLYYVRKLYLWGYNVSDLALIEYRDKNPTTKAGNVMLQWKFYLDECQNKLANFHRIENLCLERKYTWLEYK